MELVLFSVFAQLFFVELSVCEIEYVAHNIIYS